ncbi:hypothetical protein [Paraburkholderia sp. D1E]|uniref:hypothetical protein n=1 Tax=Paraburkholderia sp. D1E TaxID=3461398 RepID=UPI0040465F54
MCDDYSGHKAGFQQGITEIGWATHAMRKFFDLHASHTRTHVAEGGVSGLSICVGRRCHGREIQTPTACRNAS